MADIPKTELRILKVLSKRKGCSERELANELKMEKPNISTYVNSLAEEKSGGFLDEMTIRYYHIKDKEGLINKICHESPSPIIGYIRDNILIKFANHFNDKNHLDAMNYLAMALDHLLIDPNFYSEDRFSEIELSQEVRDLIKSNPRKGSIRRLNRLLLEEIFPNEIIKSKRGIIYKGKRRKTRNISSKHPNTEETPLYIHEDLSTFNDIVGFLNKEIQTCKTNIKLLNNRINGRQADIYEQIGPNALKIDDPQLKKIEDEEKYNKKNIGDYEDELKFYRDYLQDFLESEHTRYLAKKFGFKVILGPLLATDDCDIIEVLKKLKEKGDISHEEFVDFLAPFFTIDSPDSGRLDQITGPASKVPKITKDDIRTQLEDRFGIQLDREELGELSNQFRRRLGSSDSPLSKS